MLNTKPLNEQFSDDDLRRIVAKQLPAWKRACTASDANAIVLHESAFGRSHSELLLLACAIKYAALNKKNVHIASGGSDGWDPSRCIAKSPQFGHTASARPKAAVRTRRTHADLIDQRAARHFR
jgi:hypothetical protein